MLRPFRAEQEAALSRKPLCQTIAADLWQHGHSLPKPAVSPPKIIKSHSSYSSRPAWGDLTLPAEAVHSQLTSETHPSREESHVSQVPCRDLVDPGRDDDRHAVHGLCAAAGRWRGLPRGKRPRAARSWTSAYVTPETVAAAVAFPRRVLTAPEMEMLPVEVLSALGKKELGIDPVEIEQVMVIVDRRRRSDRRGRKRPSCSTWQARWDPEDSLAAATRTTEAELAGQDLPQGPDAHGREHLPGRRPHVDRRHTMICCGRCWPTGRAPRKAR